MVWHGSTPRDRAVSAGAAAAAVALMGWVLVSGLVRPFVPPPGDGLALFDVADPPPPVRQPVRPEPRDRPEGEAAPPNLRSEPTEVVAPPPAIPLPVPPPLPAAPLPGAGSAPSAGAADVPGPGTGAGGEGSGRGSGGSGEGDGSGAETPPRRIAGRLRDSDYPRGPLEAGIGGTVEVRYLVGANGRVLDCEIERSSGNAEIDANTCRLIQRRFRFRPSRDEAGRAVDAWIVEYHSWIPRPK